MSWTTSPRPTAQTDVVVRPTGGTRALLACGAAAGPVYIITGLIEGLTRRGFDLRHQDLSLLSNGPLGWIHISLFVVTGALVALGAVGLRQALGRRGRGALWGPLLLGVYGVGLIAAGLFVADPMAGFPPGTPSRPDHVSWHGNLHFVSAAIAFLALITACFLFTRRFSAEGRTGWARFSVVTGVVFVAAFLGVATGSSSAGVVISFSLAVVLAFTWITLLSLELRNETH